MRGSALAASWLGGGYDLLATMKALRRKHPDTYYHSVRVSLLAEKFSDRLRLEGREARDLIQGCFVHDIGKLLIDNQLLNVSGRLDEAEAQMLRQHPLLGVRLLEYAIGERILNTVRHHKEHWDGSGFPDGLAGEAIPLHARICAIADTFDSRVMRSSRFVMKHAAQGINELRRLAGKRLDPHMVELFADMLREPGALYMYECSECSVANPPDDG